MPVEARLSKRPGDTNPSGIPLDRARPEEALAARPRSQSAISRQAGLMGGAERALLAYRMRLAWDAKLATARPKKAPVIQQKMRLTRIPGWSE